MKKPLFVVSLLILILGSFLAGVYTSKDGSERQHGPSGERRVLYYVDPMNPAHTSDKPGLAPCGMAMEPVYDEEGSSGEVVGTAAMVMAPGTVKIPPQKQQVIGVQLGTVEVSSETHTVRTLGRAAADENLVYPLIAATEGWMGEVYGSTTGSLVMKDQVMAQLDVFTNEFYTWQQQYLVEVGYAERTRQTSIRQPAGWRPGSGRLSAPTADAMPRGATQPEAMQPEGMTPGAMPQGQTAQTGVQPADPQPTSPRRCLRRRKQWLRVPCPRAKWIKRVFSLPELSPNRASPGCKPMRLKGMPCIKLKINRPVRRLQRHGHLPEDCPHRSLHPAHTSSATGPNLSSSIWA